MMTEASPPLLDVFRRRMVLLLLSGLAASILLQGLKIIPVWTMQAFTEGPMYAPSFFVLCIASSFPLHLFSLPREARFRELLLGLFLECGLAGVRSWFEFPVVATLGLGFGGYALLRQAQRLFTAPPSEKGLRARMAVDAFGLPAFAWMSYGGLLLSALLRPTVWDGFVWHAEAGLGFQPMVWLSQWVGKVPLAVGVLEWVYGALPLAFACLLVLKRQQNEWQASELMHSFFLVGFVGFVLYFVFPVLGPAYFFSLPGVSPDIATLKPLLGPAGIPRNCMPSLHAAWALVLVLQSRGLSKTWRAAFFVFAALTWLSTLGLRWHYMLDLVVAVPLAVAVDAWSLRIEEQDRKEQRTLIAVAAVVVALWLLVLRLSPKSLHATPTLLWPLVLLTLALGWVLRRRVVRWQRTALDLPFETVRPKQPLSLGWIAGAFFLSGVAGMVYEVTFARTLALAFGSTSLAQTIVLATYMGGMGLGAFLGARWLERRPNPLWVYAVCELGIGAFCALSPWLLKALHAAYGKWAANHLPSEPSVVALQMGLGILVLLPPTLLMGATLPALAAYFSKHSAAVEQKWEGIVRFLYAANTVGAAGGAVLTAYLLLPTLGVRQTLWLAVGANVVAALLAMRVGKKAARASVPSPQEGSSVQESSAALLARGRWAVGILFLGGMVSLGLEVLYTHLLAVVAGNSSYAFALMLATFLLGLASGSAFGSRLRGSRVLTSALQFQVFLVLAVLLGVFAWDSLPNYFASFEGFVGARLFVQREFIRAVVCVLTMFPSAFFIGASYPLAMAEAVHVLPGRPLTSMGLASALNTLGNIVGTLLTHFLLLPQVGSFHALYVLASVALALPLLALVSRRVEVRGPVTAWVSVALVLMIFRPSSFNLTQLASGANAYFAAQPYGEVIDFAESSDGGLTTVNRNVDTKGNAVLTLLTNGKFQGDDSQSREVPAQYGLALCPLLHTEKRDSALVIGFGTGTSARAVKDAGFQHLDVVDVSQDIYTLANRYFSSVNGHVLSKNGVKAYVADGRNFLFLQDATYDFVSLEISSIWFSHAASLYNQEFYQLVKSRLRPGGVLQQWLQLHRLSLQDIAMVLATVRQEFNHVYLYFVHTQGVIVACQEDCPPLPSASKQLDGLTALQQPLQFWGGSSENLLAKTVLTPQGTEAFLEKAREALKVSNLEALVSNDDNLKLEFSTPRANVEAYAPSLKRNLTILSQFSPRTVAKLSP